MNKAHLYLIALPFACTTAVAEPARPVAETVKPAAGPAKAAAPQQADTLMEAIVDGKANAELRYRIETVDQAGMERDAYASTLRTRVRYTTAEWKGLSALVEYDNVNRIGDDGYNDTRNGKIDYPLVVDPEGSGVNQAYIRYTGLPDTALTLGRQRVNLDNQRFIGSVGWRQNEQTLDGGLAEYKILDNLTATYGYFSQVNRIHGPDNGPVTAPLPKLESDVQLLNMKYALNDMLAVTAYGYFLDFDDAAALSNKTTGLRFTGKIPVGDFKLGYTAEYARQSDYGDNLADYDAEYALAEVGFGKDNWELQAGYELLGADVGKGAVQTPLATLHKFQGWADKFLVTPATGLVDTYAGGMYKFNDYALTVTAHEFDTDEGEGDYGNEIDVQLARTFAKRYTVTLKYADYEQGDVDSITDTRKLWLMAEAKF